MNLDTSLSFATFHLLIGNKIKKMPEDVGGNEMRKYMLDNQYKAVSSHLKVIIQELER